MIEFSNSLQYHYKYLISLQMARINKAREENWKSMVDSLDDVSFNQLLWS